MQNVQQVSTTQSTDLSVSSTKQILMALTLGAALVLLVGFAPMEIVHNAAHDARHAFAFPCH
ncbi:MAG: CbtB-domain containing protein [Oceanospirillaceae bacterium]|nr:CbtB-domain containing protein [Oceanospirillaceae bacterium]